VKHLISILLDIINGAGKTWKMHFRFRPHRAAKGMRKAFSKENEKLFINPTGAFICLL